MQRVEKSGVDQVDGPDHSSRADQESPKGSSETITDELSRKDQEQATTEAPAGVVVELLNDNDVNGGKSGGSSIGHDGDQDMLLDVERSRVEGVFPTKDRESPGRENASHERAQRVGEQLSDHDTDGQWVIAEPEELVNESQHQGEEDTKEPRTEGLCWERGVICWGY